MQAEGLLQVLNHEWKKKSGEPFEWAQKHEITVKTKRLPEKKILIRKHMQDMKETMKTNWHKNDTCTISIAHLEDGLSLGAWNHAVYRQSFFF